MFRRSSLARRLELHSTTLGQNSAYRACHSSGFFCLRGDYSPRSPPPVSAPVANIQNWMPSLENWGRCLYIWLFNFSHTSSCTYSQSYNKIFMYILCIYLWVLCCYHWKTEVLPKVMGIYGSSASMEPGLFSVWDMNGIVSV